jgi:hypothetical protein
MVPVFEFISSQKVRLTEDYYITKKRYIPKGFESDLGSVPFLLHWFLKPTDIKYSSIIHDFDWLMADFGHYSYYKANISFLINSLKLDKISPYKAILCFFILELIRIFTKNNHNT